uniref:Lipocalin-like domain-containing protein n=1 Tax=uncultured bacterium BLR8 TaxID=506524 RepID=C0IN75_9BACT|nr:hypothetical protein AKSOIL_0116 [uncultured bacterium BLR8]
MRGLKQIIGALLLAAVLPVMAQTADDPALGTWKLNMAKSSVPASVGIKGMTRVYTLTHDGISMVETQQLTAGGTNTITYLFRYDGKETPVTGSKLYDSLSVKEISKGKTESVVKLKGAPAGKNVREVSKDGKTMQMDTVLKIDGKDTDVKYVFEKQ